MAKKKGRRRLIKAVGYLRCSTNKQEASIPDQRTAVQRYADENDYKIIDWYIDEGISGDDTENRLDFLRMRDDAASGDFEAVLCWKQDRFGRSDSLDAGYYIKPFRDAGVSLVTVDDGRIDWNDFSGRMMYTLKQEAKHQFLRDLSDDVIRGQIQAQINHGWNGSIPYAYRIEGPKKQRSLVLGDVEEQRVVERMFHEFVEMGRSMTDIGNRLSEDGFRTRKGNLWRPDAVKTILENPVYIGTHRWGMSSGQNSTTFAAARKSRGRSVVATTNRIG